MPDTTEVYCSVCGTRLVRPAADNAEVFHPISSDYIMVEPCEECLEQASLEGYDEGYEAREDEIEDVVSGAED